MLSGAEPDFELIERVFRFANLERIARTDDVESIFEGHPFIIPQLWNKIANQADVSGFINLQRDLRAWLQGLRRGLRGKKIAVRDDLAKRFQEKAVETALILKRSLEGKPYQVQFNAWGIPRLDFQDNGQVKFSVSPFLSGVESAIYYGVVLLFHHGLADDVQTCTYKPKGAPVCGRFFLRSKQPDKLSYGGLVFGFVTYCSRDHRRFARLQKMSSYVTKSQRKKRYPRIEPIKRTEPIDPGFVRFMDLASKPALTSGELAKIDPIVHNLGGWKSVEKITKLWKAGNQAEVWSNIRVAWPKVTTRPRSKRS